MSAPAAPALRPTPARTGVWVGIAAISMSFAAFTSALVVRRAASDWEYFRLPPILFLNTVILLASSVTLERARTRVARSQGEEARSWVVGTLALGLMFVAGQATAWRSLVAQGLYLATSPSSAFFYVFTVLHAVHLVGGIVALTYVRYRLGHPDWPGGAGAFGAAAMYWHFMAVLWLYLLFILAVRL